jgi:hypothetical protein
MFKRLLPLSLLLVSPLVSGCQLDVSVRAADVSCIPIGHSIGKRTLKSGLLPIGSRGQLAEAVAPGKAMPGGGTFNGLAGLYATAHNDAGQHAFVAVISEGRATIRAAYRLDENGKLSLILKEGMRTELGTIKHLVPSQRAGIGLNDQGQVALPARIESGRTVVLLAPKGL